MDKISFIVGVLVVWMFAYFLGRYPKDFFFTFFTILIIPLVLFRWIRYYKIGMHYYLIDLCYFSLALILYTIWYDPKNEALMRVGFLTANGCLAVSIAAFRNSLVFHDMDCITSMGLHAAPMIITHHIRWYMITEEASLPEEQRTFATISTSLRLEEYLHLNMWNPIAFYVIWLAFYAFVNFYLAESTIKRKKVQYSLHLLQRKPLLVQDTSQEQKIFWREFRADFLFDWSFRILFCFTCLSDGRV